MLHSRIKSIIIVLVWLILLLTFDALWNDSLHRFLHQMSNNGNPILSRIGYIHTSYHAYIDIDYQIHDDKLIHRQLFDNILKSLILSSIYLYPLFKMQDQFGRHQRMALMIMAIIYLSRIISTLCYPVGDIVDLKGTTKGIRLLEKMKDNCQDFYTYRVFGNLWTRSYHVAYPDEAYNDHLDVLNII